MRLCKIVYNCYDCGIYICRYAYNLFLICDRYFTQSNFTKNLQLETNSAEFQFGFNTITRISKEIDELFTKIEQVYNNFKMPQH